MAPVAAKALTAALQQPVQGCAGRLAQPGGQGSGQPLAACLQGAAQPGRRLAGGCGQVQAQLGPQGQQGPKHLHHRAGFARARSAAQQHQAMAQQGRHRLLLLAVQALGGGMGHRLLHRPRGQGRRQGGLGPGGELAQAALQLQVPAAPAQAIPVPDQRGLGVVVELAGPHHQGGGGEGQLVPLRPALRVDARGRRPAQHQLQRALLQGGGHGPNQFRQGGVRSAAIRPISAAKPGQGFDQGLG